MKYGYADRLSMDPRGGGTPGRTVGKDVRGGEACRDAPPPSVRTSRTESLDDGRLSGDVVVAPENAWRELPAIMDRIVARIGCR